jgi:hypothetical protein
MLFAELGLRIVPCTTSESDAERILSMQKSVAGLHGTRFTIAGMTDRLRGRMLSRELIAPDLVPRLGGHFDHPGDAESNNDSDDVQITDQDTDDSDGDSDSRKKKLNKI